MVERVGEFVRVELTDSNCAEGNRDPPSERRREE